MFNLSPKELSTLKKLKTPAQIQDFLDSFPINFEKNGETNLSPRRVLREHTMHCLEGALLAATVFWIHGEEPLLMDFRAQGDDEDHIVAPYKRNGYWGAISKTNHATLRFRDPVYKTLRELAVSYFHEYFDNTTLQKSLREYSRPLNMKRFGAEWITAEENLDWLPDTLDDLPHYDIFPKKNERYIRPPDAMEISAGKIVEWNSRGKKV